LIILNGPTGIGKSTIAARLQAEMPDSAVVDIDEIRRSIPDYRENRQESLALAYKQAGEIIEESLAKGLDVIIDKTITGADILDSYRAIASKHGAEVLEFILFADKDTLQKRADERGYRPGSLLTRERVGEMWEKLDTLRAERPHAIVIDTASLDADSTLAKIRSYLP
jgi:predicted kinase